MKNRQVLLKIKKKGRSISFPIKKEWKNANFYITKSENIPVKMIYAQTIWILNEGHDFSIVNNVFTSHSDLFNNESGNHILIVFGESIDVYCENNHVVEEHCNYCPECGTAIDFSAALKKIKCKIINID